jgi:hypothetical protein
LPPRSSRPEPLLGHPVVADDLDHLDRAEGDRSRRRPASWSLRPRAHDHDAPALRDGLPGSAGLGRAGQEPISVWARPGPAPGRVRPMPSPGATTTRPDRRRRQDIHRGSCQLPDLDRVIGWGGAQRPEEACRRGLGQRCLFRHYGRAEQAVGSDTTSAWLASQPLAQPVASGWPVRIGSAELVVPLDDLAAGGWRSKPPGGGAFPGCRYYHEERHCGC